MKRTKASETIKTAEVKEKVVDYCINNVTIHSLADQTF